MPGNETHMAETTRVLLSGDALITRRYAELADIELLELLDDTDIRFTNLEMLLNNYQGTPAVEAGGLHLSAHPDIGFDLMQAGFNLFANANNHSLDFGTDGLLHHLNAMNELGMCYAGVGHSLGESSAPAYLDTYTSRVGLISCAATFATGQRAGSRRDDFDGRPGLNPLRHKTVYHVTDEQFGQLNAMAEALGIAEMNRWAEEMEFRKPLDDPENQLRFGPASHFSETIYQRAEESRIVTTPNEADMARIVQSIEHARRQSDLVIVSIHAHEANVQIEKPAQFIIEFAHRCVDAGADIVTGSGPHIMRGIEIYQNKPIFYSLGNLWFEFETVNRLPADSYEMWKLDPMNLTPADLYDNALLGFHKDRRYWECALPVLSFNGRDLTKIELHPVTLGYGEPRGRRGTPRMASPEDADYILDYVKDLSAEFGTETQVSGSVGTIAL